MKNYSYKKLIKPASNYLLLATIIKYFSSRLSFSRSHAPRGNTYNKTKWWASPLLMLFLSACSENKPTINIAVASNFESTLKQIIKHYPSKQYEIKIIAGSSGVLANQILNNAPYDLFLSADTDKPQLIVEKLNLKIKSKVYAIGRLVLWIPQSTGNNCIAQLSTLNTLAIANPKTAPYGKAAQTILDKNNITVEKTIQTSNASQAYIYTKDGLTQGGFVPYSMVMNETSGCLQIFENLELKQSMVLLSDKAEGLYGFMQSKKVKLIIGDSGYHN